MKATVYDNYKYRSIPAKSADFHGFYITSRRFYHLPSVRQYGHDRKPEFSSEIKNIHTHYRKTFVCEKEISRATLLITADDVYKVYLNGCFIGEGPAQSYPFAYNVNAYDVTDLLASGENVITAAVYYQGLFNIYLMSADNLSGLILDLDIEYSDGTHETVKTDRSWRYRESSAYTPRHIYGYQTQFSEDIDLSLLDDGWRSAGYDDSAWEYAIVAANPYPIDYNMVPQITPTVIHKKVLPCSVKTIDGGYLFDFGREVVGTLCATLSGKRGERVTVRYAEELTEDGRARYEIRARCVYEDVITLSGGEDFLEYFDYKGYRYAEILDPPENFDASTVYTFERTYPFNEDAAAFSSSDASMSSIWNICANGVRVGTQDTYYDCPTREKGGFVGDALITGLSHLLLTGDLRIYKKFINDARNASRYCPAVMAHLPTYDINICADYSSLIPLFLKEYLNYTGDAKYIKSMMPMVEGIWEYYSQFLTEDGLLTRIRHMEKVPSEMNPLLIDWPENLRDGYDMDAAGKGASTVENLFFYGFLKTSAELYSRLGETERAKEFAEIYEKMGRAINNCLFDSETGLYVDATGSRHSALHSNALAMFYGLVPPKSYKPIVKLIMERRLNCGVYFAYFVIEGLYRQGFSDEAADLLRGTDEHSWVNMLREGASTCMEAWGKDQKWNTSWCHPWSSSPIYFYTSRIMGISTDRLAEGVITVSPSIPEDIKNIEIRIPLPSGTLTAEYNVKGGISEYTVCAPNDLEIIFKSESIKFIRK